MTGTLNPTLYTAHKIYNGMRPDLLPLALTLSVDFTISTSQSLKLENAIERKIIDFIQCVFVDNSLNTAPLTLFIHSTQQTVTWPAFTYGYIPVLCPNPPHITVTCTGATSSNTIIQLLNIPLPMHLTSVAGSSGAVPVSGSGENDVDNIVPVSTGLVGTVGFNYAYDIAGGKWDRLTVNPNAPSSGNIPIANTKQSLLTTAILGAVNPSNTVVEYLNAVQSTNDALVPGTLLFVENFPTLFNGASYDRQRGNVDSAALITLAAQAAGTVSSPDQTNYNNRGAKFFMNLTALTGGATCQLKVQGKDPVSGVYFDIAASAAIVATGLTVITVYPGITTTANVSLNDIIPRTYRVQAIVAVGTATGTIADSLIL